MDMTQFHSDVRAKVAELTEKFPDGFLFITSLNNREKNTHAGTVTEVTIKNAATRICENTHAVSTPAEIAGYKARAEAEFQKNVTAAKAKIEREVRIVVDAKSTVPAELKK